MKTGFLSSRQGGGCYGRGGAEPGAFPIGDGACLEAVIARYGQALLRYCHHILCDYHEAQDAVQDALLRAWSRRNRFRAGTNLEAWLYKLAYHACIDLLRQRRRQLFAPPPPSGYNPDYIGRSCGRPCPSSRWRSGAWSSDG